MCWRMLLSRWKEICGSFATSRSANTLRRASAWSSRQTRWKLSVSRGSDLRSAPGWMAAVNAKSAWRPRTASRQSSAVMSFKTTSIGMPLLEAGNHRRQRTTRDRGQGRATVTRPLRRWTWSRNSLNATSRSCSRRAVASSMPPSAPRSRPHPLEHIGCPRPIQIEWLVGTTMVSSSVSAHIK